MTAKDPSETATDPKTRSTLRLDKSQGTTQVRQSLSSGKSHTVAVEVKGRSLKSNRLSLQHTHRSRKRTPDKAPPSSRKQGAPPVRKEGMDQKRREFLQSLLTRQEEEDKNQTLHQDLEKKISLARESRARKIKEKEETQDKEAARKKDLPKEAPQDKAPAKVESPAPEVKATKKSRKGEPAQESSDGRKRRAGKLSIGQAISGENVHTFELRRRQSLAVIQRRRDKDRQKAPLGVTTKRQQRQVAIPSTIVIRELAVRMAVRSNEVIKVLMTLGLALKPTQSIDAETAEVVVIELGHTPKLVEEKPLSDLYISQEDSEESLKPRPPVVTVMGHVDHGKTSLLDKIRHSRITAQERGGITQQIGAYQVEYENKMICFIDTPGHNAFSAMRARGADVTDIVVLVVAADDGVRPQTQEAIAHARAAKKPIIVAINKIDSPQADSAKIHQQLLSAEIITEALGGDVQFAEVSAQTGQGLDQLLASISLQAEILELKANPDRSAIGRVIEARLDASRGTIASLLVQRGTLKHGDILVAGKEYGRVRSMSSDVAKKLTQAGPSTPVEIMGLQTPPMAGDDFFVVKSETEARNIARARVEEENAQDDTVRRPDLFSMQKQGEDAPNTLNLLVKADTQGSLEAICAMLSGLQDEQFIITRIATGVGAVKESDILLAKTSAADLIAFHVRIPAQIKGLAKAQNVTVFETAIIYEVLDYIAKRRKGIEPQKMTEQILGRAEVRQVFHASKLGQAAGCLVQEGRIKHNTLARILRKDKAIHTSKIVSLRRHKDDVSEVLAGTECGIGIENFSDIQAGDMIECYNLVEDET